MQYVGLQTQIDRNNRMSILLLLGFPCIILGMVWLFLFLVGMFAMESANGEVCDFYAVNMTFLNLLPWVVGIVAVWFVIAYYINTSMIKNATGARSLERRENPRIYNIVENLTMTCGMDMPKINIIDDPQLNAFASGIDRNSYTVTVTTGLLDLLNDEELQGVIGHELTHIRNRDTRLLITSIIFVGIISTVMSFVTRIIIHKGLYGSSSSRDKKNGASTVVILLIALVCSAIGYAFCVLTRFAISRSREYMADAGGAELCGNPLALASALRKISGNPGLQHVKREDVAQLFIIRPKAISQGFGDFINSAFRTHPDTEKRIEILEQF